MLCVLQCKVTMAITYLTTCFHALLKEIPKNHIQAEELK